MKYRNSVRIICSLGGGGVCLCGLVGDVVENYPMHTYRCSQQKRLHFLSEVWLTIR